MTLASDVLPAAGRCQRCGARVAWVKTARKKNLPLDPEPSRNPLEGNFGLDNEGVAYFIRDAVRTAAIAPDGTSEFPIYIAHFATCKAGKRHAA